MMNRQEKLAIAIQSLFNFADVMYRMFVSVYLYVYTNSLVKTTVYTLIRFTVLVLFIYISGLLNKKHKLSFTFFIGLLCQALSLVWVLTQGRLFEINMAYVYIAAIFMGVGEGLYWFSANTFSQLATTKSRRPRYLSFLGFFRNSAALLAPIVANRFMVYSSSELNAYKLILILLAIIYSIITLLSLFITARAKNTEINIKRSFDLKNEEWRDQLISQFCFAVRESLNWAIISILISNAAGDGETYSSFQTLFQILGLCCYAFLVKLLNKKRVSKTFFLGACLNSSSILVLAFAQNTYGVVIYGLLNALSEVFFNNSSSLITSNILENNIDDINGRMVVREISMYLGRLLASVVIIICFYILPEGLNIKVPIVIFSIFPFICYSVLIKHK